jgi:signal transduction histidine kinase
VKVSSKALRASRRLPFLPLAPAAVVVLGVLTAVVVVVMGITRLHAQSDDAAALRAELLSTTLAERLRATGAGDRATLVERAARRSGAEVLLAAQDGSVIVDASLSAPHKAELVALLVAIDGEQTTRLGRTRFHVAPLGPPLSHLSVIVFVRAPEAPFASSALLLNVAALTAILIGMAAMVAFAIARGINADVDYTRERIVDMAGADAAPEGKPVPVRSIDQIGLLTSSFNALVERFTAAAHAYHQDLTGALAYDRDRAAFLAALSHELRTPLNAILGFTEVLLSEVDGTLSADARENLEVVRTSGEHLRALIDDILDLSALESGELELARRETALWPIAEEVVRELSVIARAKGVELVLDGQPTSVWADPRRVRQILTNVVGNAVKFTAQGSVRLTLSRSDELGLIVVRDSGPGIRPEDQRAIFDEYRQAGDARSRSYGTGLGLAITRRLVDMHGGKIELKSELGVGTRVSIRLPLEETP